MTPLEAANLAQAVYSAPPEIGVEGSAGRAVAYGGVVAFPGSNNIACWLADLDAATTGTLLGVIHKGFWLAWLEVQRGVLALPDVQVTVGHSEGAALAIIAAANLCLIGRPPAEVFAFEPPRVTTDDTLAALFAKHGVELHLYRNGEDVVPIVPRLFESWRHPAPLISIGKASVPWPNVDDHMMNRVIASLQGLPAVYA